MRIFVLIVLNVFVCLSIGEAGLSKSLVNLTDRDTLCKVWVQFTDKENGTAASVSPPAVKRRANANYTYNNSDLAISEKYIKSIQASGGVLKHTFKWENAASFLIPAKKLEKISSLPFVRSVAPVGKFTAKYNTVTSLGLSKKQTEYDQTLYGGSYDQFQIVNIPAVHKYLLEEKKYSAPGENVLIGFFDTGFRLDHPCFSIAREHVKAKYDFIDNDTSVADPDSVTKDASNPFYRNDEHGSLVLSIVAGYDPGKYVGAAWGANFVLARTENASADYGQCDLHSEEDDWAAAVVWAESLGVDIISSSLGYREDFLDTAIIPSGDTTRKVVDYQYSDLDGKTTIVSRAARDAIIRGVVIVNAMGNEQHDNLTGTLSAPADVDGVISVGALNRFGTTITDWSSTGPTADGRIKPDVVVPGDSVVTARIYDPSSYMYISGTSVATPIVTGICALIMQSFQTNNADVVRQHLFNSCKFARDQRSIDNVYGRGIPDALNACKENSNVSAQRFSVYPSVLKSGTTCNFTFTINDHLIGSKITLCVYSIDGKLIWKKNGQISSGNPKIATWESKGRNGEKLVSGIYYAILKTPQNMYSNKFIVTEKINN